MLLHIHSKGGRTEIQKMYRTLAIPVNIVSHRYIRNADVAACTGIVVDSLASLANLSHHLTDVKLNEGGKCNFKALFASSILTTVIATGHIVRLMAGMTTNQLYLRVNKILYMKALKKFTHAHTYQRLSEPNISYVTSDLDIMARAESRGKILLIAVDTETKQEGIIINKILGQSYWIYNVIELVQYTFVYKLEDGSYNLETYVVPFKKRSNYDNIKRINSSPYPKATSNGHYDLEQFIHWRVPLVNWAWDVEYYMRSITSDFIGFYNLGANSALHNLDIKYWKDLTKHNEDRNENQQKAFIRYSGLDSHWTAGTAINQIAHVTAPNVRNLVLKRQFDGLTAWMNLQLLPVDKVKREELVLTATRKWEKCGETVRNATGLSHTQAQSLYPLFKKLHLAMRVLGYKDLGKLPNLMEKELDGLRTCHPVMEAIVDTYLQAKQGDKDISTFLNYIKYYKATDLDKKFPYFDYAMSQYTAVTLRYASSSSHAWCGGNVQNIGYTNRQQFGAPKGMKPLSIDAPQSEARTVGYLSNCRTIIKVLEDPKLDYHIFNAANAVFIIDYEDVTKAQRTLSKPAGFGFFYGQTYVGLAKSLGVTNLRKIRTMLGLDEKTPLLQVARKVSQGIDKLYWEIRKEYYPKVIAKFLRYGRVPCVTGYAPVICSDINKQGTTNTIVCIDGQHTSAYINMIGGAKMLNHYIYGTTKMDKAMYPYLQLHDEIQAFCKEDITVREVDDHTEMLFKNAYVIGGKTMSIPRGIPVFGNHMHELKHDEIERTPEYLDTPLKDLPELN